MTASLHARLRQLGWTDQVIELGLKIHGAAHLEALYPEPPPPPPTEPAPTPAAVAANTPTPPVTDPPHVAHRAMALSHSGGWVVSTPIRSRRTGRPIPPPPPTPRKRPS